MILLSQLKIAQTNFLAQKLIIYFITAYNRLLNLPNQQ